MRKIKIYLDTSAISHLEQNEKTFEQTYSRQMSDCIKAGLFVVCLSGIVFDEINACSPPLKDALLRHLSEIDFEDISINSAINTLAAKLIEKKVLPKGSLRDSQHIAAAIVAGCDYIISWNMKHMANVKINRNIRHIIIDEGYKEILLIPPTMLLDEEAYNENDC